jgi:hypothetical protein
MKNAIAFMILIAATAFGQVRAGESPPVDVLDSTRVEIPELGVSFRPIKGWHLAGRQALVDNLHRHQFKQDELARILATSGDSRTVASFMRNDPRQMAGVIPTVNIIAKPASETSAAAVHATADATIMVLKQTMQDLRLIEKTREVPISQGTAYRFILEFSLKKQDGTKAAIRNQTFIVPRDGMLLQISMSESLPTREDLTFQAFIDAFEVK